MAYVAYLHVPDHGEGVVYVDRAYLFSAGLPDFNLLVPRTGDQASILQFDEVHERNYVLVGLEVQDAVLAAVEDAFQVLFYPSAYVPGAAFDLFEGLVEVFQSGSVRVLIQSCSYRLRLNEAPQLEYLSQILDAD